MTERQRTGRPGSTTEDSGDGDTESNLDEVRELADQLMANAQRSMQRLGLSDASDFLNATRQSGGQ